MIPAQDNLEARPQEVDIDPVGVNLGAGAPACEEILRAYPWPGNVRQLQNVVRNTVVMNDGEAVTPDMLPAPLGRFAAEAEPELRDPPIRDVNFSPLPSDPSELIVPLARLEP